MTSKIALIAAAVLVATTAGASAHSSKYDVDARQERQADAIERGRETGAITWKEGLKLKKEQREIAETEAQFRADGRLSKGERQILKNMQDEAATHIASEKQDGWRRPWWLPRVGR
jgi:uncharacterized protein HemX